MTRPLTLVVTELRYFKKTSNTMALIKLNPIAKAVSGRIGRRLVMKNYGNTTILSRKPSNPKKRSPLQLKNAQKFRSAAAFAKAATGNPEIKEYYNGIARERNQHSAYLALIKDFLDSPVHLTEEVLLERARMPRVAKEKQQESGDALEFIVTMPQGEIIVQGQIASSKEDQWTYTAPYSGIQVVIQRVKHLQI